jgi:hypothetical protein
MSQGELLALYLSERLMRQFRGTPFEPDLRQGIANCPPARHAHFDLNLASLHFARIGVAMRWY